MPFPASWRWLDHHDRRRRQRVPTVSVVPDEAVLAGWAARDARSLVRLPRRGEPGAVHWLADPLPSAARAALAFVENAPSETLALVVAPGDLDAYRCAAPPSRAKTLLLAGIVPRDEPAAEPTDAAKSQAERFLFAQLEALPATRGLFVLNAPAGFRFGPAEAEVDLLCAARRVAVEIDGWHHFQDADAYRRDRRKDLALQAHGYLVLRFLADDVVARLEDILATIHSAIEQ